MIVIAYDGIDGYHTLANSPNAIQISTFIVIDRGDSRPFSLKRIAYSHLGIVISSETWPNLLENETDNFPDPHLSGLDIGCEQRSLL